MKIYYNEIDFYAAQWLRNLIDAKQIARGNVDERDIRDVAPTDLAGYDRCHFFAGIAGWDYALQLAGWPRDLPVWTGSCPCQPFSAAGRGGKGIDERHLWPAWFHLIRVCRPPIIFGEQVASKDGLKWLDLVCSDLEAEGYAVGAADLCAAGVGAPHIRQRLWFVASVAGSTPTGLLGHTEERGCERNILHKVQQGRNRKRSITDASRPSPTGKLADSLRPRFDGGDQRGLRTDRREMGKQEDGAGFADQLGHGCKDAGSLADSSSSRFSIRDNTGKIGNMGRKREQTENVSSCFSNYHWLPCRDGKARPTEPGVFPLAHGVSARVGRLRAYGNAIVPQVAAEFIRAFMETQNV